MKSKVLESWIGQRVVVEQYHDNHDGVLLEVGSCWVVLAITREADDDREPEVQFVRVGGNNVIRRALAGELTPLAKWRLSMRRDPRPEFDPFAEGKK